MPIDRKLAVEHLEDRRLLAVFTVDTVDDTFDGSIVDGSVSLRDAVHASNNLPDIDTIDFDPSVFSTPQTISLLLGELELTQSVFITGPGQDLLTIDAQHNSRIFRVSSPAVDLTIRKLTLTGGRTTADGIAGRGGAIGFEQSGTLTIEDSTITGNSTDGEEADGGAVYAIGDIVVNRSTISYNSTAGARASGGGIAGQENVTITVSSIRGNSTSGDGARGGGIHTLTGHLELATSSVSHNQTAGSIGYGGGLSAGSATITQSTISGNHTFGGFAGGGGVFIRGIQGMPESLTVDSSTITGNSVASGARGGGGIFTQNSSANINNSIIAGNTTGIDDPDLRVGFTTQLSVNYTLIGDTSGLNPEELAVVNAGAGNILNLDPKLGPLAFNGGPTKTHALLPGSPAIDKGDPTLAPNAAEFDQRGAPFLRVVNDAGGLRADMGAYERQSIDDLNLVVDNPVDEFDGNLSQGNLSLREAISLANASVGEDVITFDAGVFATQQTIPLQLGELEVTDSLVIDGPGQELLTLDAQQQSRIFYSSSPDVDFTITGLTLTGGRTSAYGTKGRGGAIRSRWFGTLTIEDSTITGNSTANDAADGGGIQAGGDVVLLRTTVSGNSTAGDHADGGGVYASRDVTVIESLITGNSTGGDDADGGGVAAYRLGGASIVTIIRSVIDANFTGGDAASGGGVYADGYIPLFDSVVSNNSTGLFGHGGGIAAGLDAFVTGSTVSGNFALGNGAGIYTKRDSTVTNSTISENGTTRAQRRGVGISSGGDVTLLNSTVSANWNSGTQAAGVGVYAEEDVFINFSTVTENRALGSYPEFGIGVRSHGVVRINNSIVAGNATNNPVVPTTGPLDVYAAGGNASIIATYSLIGAGVRVDAGGGNIFSDDPLLGRLADNGGPTLTHAPLPDSPVVNGAHPTASEPQFDQRGQREAPFLRVIAGRADMGAVESPYTREFDLLVDALGDEDDGLYGVGELTVREAVALANEMEGANTITFDPTVFTTPQTIYLTEGELSILEEVTIEGPGQHLLTIDAQQNSRIFNIDSPTGDFTIAGMTLTGGLTTGDNVGNTAFSGGAIRSTTTGMLNLTQVTVADSSTTGYLARGGGVYARRDVTLTDSTVNGNSSNNRGGGVSVFGRVTLVRSTVSNNTTSLIQSGGGGIFAPGDVTLTDSTVSGNRTLEFASGGGILSYGDIMLTRSTVSGNSAGVTGNGDGGGIFASDNVILVDSTVSGNSASRHGGGIRAGYSLSITNSTVSGNRATGASSRGAGIYVGSHVDISNSTITDNHAAEPGAVAGGLWISSSPTTIRNSIIAGNTAGGGMADIRPGVNFSPTIRYTLIGDNDGTDLSESHTPDANGNLVGGVVGGVINPMLGPLTSLGGPTLTHAPLPGSPVIDTGDPDLDLPSADQRGELYSQPVGGRLDMGAVEHQNLHGFGIVVDIATDEDDGDYSRGDLSLREAVRIANETPGADLITFDVFVFATAQTLELELGEIVISEALTITGPGRELLTIDAQQESRIFNFTAGTGDFTISGLNLIQGRTIDISIDGAGGAVHFASSGFLTISESTIAENATFGIDAVGGAVYSAGQLWLANTTLERNVTNSDGAHGGGAFAADDVTLIGSTVSGNSTARDDARGGGIYTGDRLILNASTVTGNHTFGEESDGGGVAAVGQVSITGSIVTENSTSGERAGGGGIDADSGVNLTNSTVSGNSTSGDGAGGGGLRASGDVVLTNGVLSNNRTSGTVSGGGAIISGGDFVATDSSISFNSTEGQTSPGGGIRASGNVTLTGSIVLSNSTIGLNSGGGGIRASASVFLTRSTIQGNSTSGEVSNGGGIAASEDVSVDSSTISGNRTFGSARGGGIISGGGITLTNSTLSGNSVAPLVGLGQSAGAAWAQDGVTINHSTVTENTNGVFSVNGPVHVEHSIVAGNIPGDVGFDLDIDAENVFPAVDHSIIGLNVELHPLAVGEVVRTNDPMLGPLAGNGGPTRTHAPLAESPAIDLGLSNYAAAPANDQRGDMYVRANGGRIDAGAVEVQPFRFVRDFDGDDDVTVTDLIVWELGFGKSSGAKTTNGDANFDNAVDGRDLLEFQRGYTGAALAPSLAALNAEAELADKPSPSDFELSQFDRISAITATAEVEQLRTQGQAPSQPARSPDALPSRKAFAVDDDRSAAVDLAVESLRSHRSRTVANRYEQDDNSNDGADSDDAFYQALDEFDAWRALASVR